MMELSLTERAILCYRWLAMTPLSLEEIGAGLGMEPEAVHALEVRLTVRIAEGIYDVFGRDPRIELKTT